MPMAGTTGIRSVSAWRYKKYYAYAGREVEVIAHSVRVREPRKLWLHHVQIMTPNDGFAFILGDQRTNDLEKNGHLPNVA